MGIQKLGCYFLKLWIDLEPFDISDVIAQLDGHGHSRTTEQLNMLTETQACKTCIIL